MEWLELTDSSHAAPEIYATPANGGWSGNIFLATELYFAHRTALLYKRGVSILWWNNNLASGLMWEYMMHHSSFVIMKKIISWKWQKKKDFPLRKLFLEDVQYQMFHSDLYLNLNIINWSYLVHTCNGFTEPKTGDSPTICPLTVSLSLGPSLFRSKRWSVNEQQRRRKFVRNLLETTDPRWRLRHNRWLPLNLHLSFKIQLGSLHIHVWGHIHCTLVSVCVCLCASAQRQLYSSQTVDVPIGLRLFQKHAEALCHCRKERDRNNKYPADIRGHYLFSLTHKPGCTARLNRTERAFNHSMWSNPQRWCHRCTHILFNVGNQ